MRRSLLAIASLLAVSVLVFAATVALPGGAARAILGPTATAARIAALNAALHLNRPLLQQYLDWLGNFGTGNFGHSLANGQSVLSYLGPSLGNSAMLVLFATLVSVPLSILLGMVSARRPGGPADTTITFFATASAALPEFVIGILLISLFATNVFHIFPPSALTSGGAPWVHPTIMILPVATLTFVVTPYISRNVRESVLAVRSSDYVEFAEVSGLDRRTIATRYVLPNAIGPTLQVIAAEVAWLAGGIVLVEYVFDYPGIGSQLVYAISNRDIPVIQFLSLLIGAVYVVGNLCADLAGVLFAPTTRLGLG